MRELTIGKNDAGQRLDRFVSKSLPLLPPALLQKYIRIKRIKCNGARCQRDQRLNEGDVLQLYINDEFFDKPREDNAYLTVANPKLNIVYEDEQTGSQYTVGTYIAEELGRDEIALQTPIFAQILNETILHQSDQNFTAERYFINHPDPAISKLAVDLAEEKYQLSKYHSKTQTIMSEAERVGEIVDRLLLDYKLSIVDMELKEALDQLSQPAIMNDTTKSIEVMTRCKQLMEIKQQMSKMLGDRVIGA